MRKVALLSLAVLALTCGPSPDAQLPNLPGLKGGSTGSGGVKGSGGSAGSGGTRDEGGAGGAGGSEQGSGGTTHSGGSKTGTGGRSGTGGRTAGDDAGPDGRRDAPRGTGGAPGDGGTTGTSRDAGRGGAGGTPDARDVPGRDSLLGSGGIGGRDAPIGSDAVAASCYATIVDNGYACGSAAPCSECKDTNGVLKETQCRTGLDCLAAAGASCDNNCQLKCLNQAGDMPIQNCIKALTTAACSATGGGC